MIIKEDVCRAHVQLVFTILKRTKEWWIRTNILVALGDLLCTHPNVVQPYLHPSQGHLFDLLHDADHRVRSTTVMVCTHLALNDMLRVAEMVPLLLALIADDAAAISNMGKVFLQELHNKNKVLVYNMLPTICMHLSGEFGEGEKFNSVMKLVLEKIEKDKQTESTIEKLCAKFPMMGTAGNSESDISVARNIAFCLSELNYSSDRAVNKIISDQSFAHYKKWLRDDIVKKYIMSIASKAKRNVPGTSGESRREKASVEDWEKKLQGEFAEVARLSGSSEGAAGPKTRGAKARRAKNNRESDESDASANSDSSEDMHPSQKERKNVLTKISPNESDGKKKSVLVDNPKKRRKQKS
jgi:condensin complex subunit 1